MDSKAGAKRGPNVWWFVGMIGLPAVVTAGLLLPIFLLSERLPDPLAIRWAFSGIPTGKMSATLFLLFITLPWLVFLLRAWFSRPRGTPSRFLPLAYGAGGVFLSANVLVVRANLDASSWMQVRWDGLGFGLLAALGSAVVGVYLGRFLAIRGWPNQEAARIFESTVRCSAGHLFVTTWIPGVSLNALRWFGKRFQRCPVGKHWVWVKPVDEPRLTEAERAEAATHRHVAVP